MPRVQDPGILRAVYQETARRLAAREMPTDLIDSSRTLYRSFDVQHLRINLQGSFPKRYANQALVIRDQNKDENRFSGQSLHRDIPASGGLYCSLQHTAQIAELQHYARFSKGIPRSEKTGFPKSEEVLVKKCVVKIRLMGVAHVADLSPHNAAARPFLEEVGGSAGVRAAFALARKELRSLAEEFSNSEDCSVARGVGLAIANSGYLRGLQAGTVRSFEATGQPVGDNVVFFGKDHEQVAGLWVEEAYIFPMQGPPQAVSVSF